MAGMVAADYPRVDAPKPGPSGGASPTRNTRPEGPARNRLATTGGDDRADQFEVLEHDVAVVPAGALHQMASHRERAGEVAIDGAVQQRSRRVPHRVPREGIEVVLRTHDVRLVEQGDDP